MTQGWSLRCRPLRLACAAALHLLFLVSAAAPAEDPAPATPDKPEPIAAPKEKDGDKKDKPAAPPSPDVYRIPAGSWIVALLILFELLIAASIVQSDIREKSWDSAYTLALLAGLALVYLLWRRIVPAEGRSG